MELIARLGLTKDPKIVFDCGDKRFSIDWDTLNRIHSSEYVARVVFTGVKYLDDGQDYNEYACFNVIPVDLARIAPILVAVFVKSNEEEGEYENET